MRHLLLALLLLGVAALFVHLERDRQAFTALIRVRSADGLYLTLVQPATKRRSTCSAVLERFERALKPACAGCTVESAACQTALAGMDRALAAGERLPIYTIDAGAIRVGLLGPPRSVQAECEAMARQFVRSGLASAACVAPPAHGSS